MQTDLVAIVLNYLGYGVGIAAIGAAVIVVIAALARAVFLPGDVRRQACCGGCGHPVGATPGAACPECGGAFGKVGIITPSMALRWRGGLGLAILAWSILCTVGAAPLYEAARRMRLPQAAPALALAFPIDRAAFSSTFKPSPRAASAADSSDEQRRRAAEAAARALDFQIECKVEFLDAFGGPPKYAYARTARFNLRRDGTSPVAELEVDSLNVGYTLRSSERGFIQGGKTISESVIRAWFAAAKIDVDHEYVANSLSDAKMLVSLAMDNPESLENCGNLVNSAIPKPGSLRYTGGLRMTMDDLQAKQVYGPPRAARSRARDWPAAFGAVSVAVPAAIWLAGVVWMVRRRRRMLAG